MKYRLLLLLLVISVYGAFAQSHKNEIGLELDNDSFLAQGSDRYYTNGVFIYYRHALDVNTDSTDLRNKVLGFEAGQKMYNPQSGFVPNQYYIDRPFAAYLYIGTTLNLLYGDESNLKLGAQLGVVGPAALGEQVQKFIHKTFGFYSLNGWQYQVDNDFELNLSAEYNKLIVRGDWADLTFTSYGNLGNGFTGAGLGPMLRLGDFNQLFNSISTQSSVKAFDVGDKLTRYELFFYYKPQINAVIYDATVQGSLFGKKANTQEVTETPDRWVLSNQFGVSYSGRRLGLDASVIFHTRDVTTMIRSHQWGTITAFYRFH